MIIILSLGISLGFYNVRWSKQAATSIRQYGKVTADQTHTVPKRIGCEVIEDGNSTSGTNSNQTKREITSTLRLTCFVYTMFTI